MLQLKKAFDKQEAFYEKISLVNFIGALIILLTVWVPPTRIFLTDVDFGTPIVGVFSLLLCISTVGAYKKYKQRIDTFYL
jgi:hypothetical protein